MILNTRTKVVVGFLLAGILIVGVSALTYISVKNLMASVDVLSRPNERLMEYNELLSDVYQLDRFNNMYYSRGDLSDTVDYLSRVQDKLEQLKREANDPIEIYKLESIQYNVEELGNVHSSLSEVKKNLLNRDFSKEALTDIERKIKRQEESAKLRDLRRMGNLIDTARSRVGGGLPPGREPTDTEEVQGLSQDQEDDLEELVEELMANLGGSGMPGSDQPRSAADSLLYLIRNYIANISDEERYLRSRLAYLEQQLMEKNQYLIYYIQDIIGSLQNEALRQSLSENEAAYNLTYRLSMLLGFLTLLGVAGSALFIFSIIKEINKADTYRSQLEEAKNRSDNLAKAKQDFLANMSHEIRNPLHVIQGYNKVLGKTKLDEKQKEYLAMASLASDNLLGVVNDILDFSKMEAGKIEISKHPFDPFALFTNIKKFFESRAREKGLVLSLRADLPDDSWMIGDELRITQILNNLLSNAVKFTEKGEINIEVAYREKTSPQLEITVQDTGIGMSPDAKKGLFSEFHQGDGTISRKFGGTGLGLAIVKKLIDSMRGTIDLESEEGKGTVVTVYLPIELTSPQRAAEEQSVDENSLQDLKILLVDDDHTVLKFTELILSSLGAKVTSYHGGTALRDDFQELDYDLAMLDLQMPEVSGYDALKIIRDKNKYKNLPVFALTANVYAEEKESIKAEGFNGLILKPFKERELVSQVLQYFDLPDKRPEHKQATPAGKANPEKPYDLSRVEKYCMGDSEMLKELVIDFCSQTQKDLTYLDSSLKNEDYGRLKDIAHQLASRLAQFNIDTGKKAKDLEDRLKSGNKEGVDHLVNEIEQEVYGVLKEMKGDYDYTMEC